MKDIDFDELDRAVSSVLTAKDKVAVAPEVINLEPTQTLSSEPEMAAKVEQLIATPVSVPVVSSRQILSSSPAARRGGRFMDVMHPSSDMKTVQPVATSSARRPLMPISDDLKQDAEVKEETTQAETTASYPTLDTLPEESVPRTETPEPVTTIESIEDDAAIAHDQTKPEPFEQEADPARINPPVFEAASEPQQDELETVDALAETAMTQEANERTAQTPFLPDTKVDKRPLGAFASSDENEKEGDVAPLDSADSIDPNVVFGSDEVPNTLPSELNAEVLALDSNENNTSALSEKQPAADQGYPHGASILKQYKTDEKPADTTTHSVFDTSAYHQPLLPQKTKSGSKVWIWVLLVVGLLLVGAGLGAVSFMAGY